MTGQRQRYEYDVFLSYSRKSAWPEYIRRHFRPIFEHWLGAELGREVRLYQDVTNVEPGQAWRRELRAALDRSKVMVSLWTKEYFASETCRFELSLMLARAEAFRIRGAPAQVILPVELHDGEDFPDFLQEIQSVKFQEHNNPFMQPDGAQREQLSNKLKVFAYQVGRAIQSVPAESCTWSHEEPDAYLARFPPHVSRQLSLPSLAGGGS